MVESVLPSPPPAITSNPDGRRDVHRELRAGLPQRDVVPLGQGCGGHAAVGPAALSVIRVDVSKAVVRRWLPRPITLP